MTSYDTTFCEGKKCKRREQCYRHRQLLRYRADPDCLCHEKGIHTTTHEAQSINNAEQ